MKIHINKNHKKLWVILFLMIIIPGFIFFNYIKYAPDAHAAVCTTTGNGNWGSAGTWSGCGGGIPTSADSVVISNDDTVTVNITTAVAADITIDANTSGGGNGINFNSGQSLTVSGAMILNIPTASTTLVNVNSGSLSVGSISIPGSATGGRFATVSVNTGTVTVSGDIIFSGTAAQARYISTGASTTNIGGTFGSGGTLTTSGTGVFNFNGSTTQTIGAYTTYNNVQINNISGGVTLDGATTIGGTLLVNTGTLDLGGAAVFVVTGATTINSTLRISDITGSKTFGDITIADGGNFDFTAAEDITENGNLVVNGTGIITGTSGLWTFQRVGGGTISGTGTSVQNIGSVTFLTNYSNGLNIAVSGTTTINSPIVLTNNSTYTSTSDLTGTGTFTQGSTGILNIAGGSSITTLNASAIGNIVNYIGSIAQTLHTNIYQTLDVSGNTNGNVEIAANVTANTNLNLGATKLSTATSTMIIGTGANLTRTSGYIVGNLQKNVTTGATSLNFEVGDVSNYTPVDISFGNVTITGNLIVSTTLGDHPNIGTSTINPNKTANRYWTITDSGIIFDNYSAVFHFINPGDLDIGTNTVFFIAGKFSVGAWSYPTVGIKTSTSTQATGLIDFGDFQLGQNTAIPNAPILVSPTNGLLINDNTPTLSANFSDSDGDTGTTNYRISSSSLGDCNNNINIVASGSSITTVSNNEDTTFTPGSSIGGSGTYYWCAQNDDGVLQSVWTSMGNFILDSTVPVISDTSPATNAFINSITTSSDVSYTLSETITSGSITMTRTGGTADPSSPHVCILTGTALNAGVHATLDMSDTTNSCTIAQSLVSGAIYTFTFNATDAASNPAITVTNTGITFDDSDTLTITITAPTKISNSTITNTTIHVVGSNTISNSNVVVDPLSTIGYSNFNCIQTNGITVDCTINITSSGNLVIRATDNSTIQLTQSENNYVIDVSMPTITITSQTISSTTDITDTIIHVTDDTSILASNITIDPSTTAEISNFVCTQTNIQTVDCTLTINSSGVLVIRAVDDGNNIVTQSTTNFLITRPLTSVAVVAPTGVSSVQDIVVPEDTIIVQTPVVSISDTSPLFDVVTQPSQSSSQNYLLLIILATVASILAALFIIFAYRRSGKRAIERKIQEKINLARAKNIKNHQDTLYNNYNNIDKGRNEIIK